MKQFIAILGSYAPIHENFRVPAFLSVPASYDRLGAARRQGQLPLKGLARAVCVICDDSGHKPKQRWWKIVAHSLDDE